MVLWARSGQVAATAGLCRASYWKSTRRAGAGLVPGAPERYSKEGQKIRRREMHYGHSNRRTGTGNR